MSKTTTKPAAVAVALAGGILLAGSTFAIGEQPIFSC